ncbi:MAG: peptide ABC transporter substrate-binding protein [Bacillota bacterium]|nr:peptide ABC transporter substrate-binding protein [Bacillota bacterium]
MKKFLILALAFCLVFSLAACGGGDTEEPAGDESGAAEGFSITVCFASEPQTIDPALNSAVDGAIMLQHLFEGLIKWVDNGEGNATLAPGQAETWDVSEDGMVYTFHLREGITWSDGEPVTAQDFVYSWQRLVNPETAADYNYMIDMVAGANEIMAGEADPSTLGVAALDESTLEVTLTYACPFFEEIVAFPATFPVRQDVIEANGDQWTFDPATYVSNGPYTMTEWEHNSYILMEKNPNHYDVDNLGPDSIRFALMDDANAMLAGFNSGELDFIQQVPVDEIPALTEQGVLVVDDYVGTYYVCFQNQLEPFNDARVREAFSLVIDRNYIIDQITRTGEVAATAFVPSGVYDAEGADGDDFRTVGGDYYSTAAEDYEANCERARELLAEAGYPNGEGFPLVEYLYNTDDRHRAIGEALQNMWQTELGVTVTMANQDWAVFLQVRKDGDYSIARNGWIADYNDPISFLDMWMTGGGNNDAQYSNAEYDALITEAKSTSVPEDRMAAMHAAEDIIIGQDHALAPIYYYKNYHLMNESLQGMYYTPLGYYFFGYSSMAE